MNPTENGTTREKVAEPKCPHCGKRLRLGASVVAFGPLEAAVFFDVECQKVISVSVLPLPPTGPPQDRGFSKSGLILPGGM
jgi:hypothetical protein